MSKLKKSWRSFFKINFIGLACFTTCANAFCSSSSKEIQAFSSPTVSNVSNAINPDELLDDARNDDKKFEPTDETLEYCGRTLHRVKALKDFGDAKKGDVGGWVEKEENLSQDGCCWIYDDAKVFGKARVYGDAIVSDDAEVYDNAQVYDNAIVCGNAEVSWKAQVFGDAEVCGNAKVFIDARVYGSARVYGNALVYDAAKVFGAAQVRESARVSWKAKVYGDAIVRGNAQVGDYAKIQAKRDYLTLGPVGPDGDYATFYRTKKDDKEDVRVKCGSFNGTLDEFEKVVELRYGDDKPGKQYKILIEFARVRFGKKKNRIDEGDRRLDPFEVPRLV